MGEDIVIIDGPDSKNEPSSDKDAEVLEVLDKICSHLMEILFSGNNCDDSYNEQVIEDLKSYMLVEEGALIIDNNQNFIDVPDNALKRALLEKLEDEKRKGVNVETIDIRAFDSADGTSEFKGRIHSMIGNNYPMLEVSRLLPGSKVMSVLNKRIKKLNDTTSRDFVNLFVSDFKKYLSYQLQTIKLEAEELPGDSSTDSKTGKHRLVKSGYKNQTFSIDTDDDISKDFFGGVSSINLIIEAIFKGFKNNNKEKAEIALRDSKVKDIDEVKALFLKHFDIGVGVSFVEDPKTNSSDISVGIKGFYGGEIASRRELDFEDMGENLEFKFSFIKECANKALEVESHIVATYADGFFERDGTKFPVVVNGLISDKLLQYVRGKENISDPELYDLVGEYIDSLNTGFDFIAPYTPGESTEYVKEINSEIHNGVISPKWIQENYKKCLIEDALKIESKGKEGMRCIVDIVGMGIINLHDFRELAINVRDGEITENKMQELIEAGRTASIKIDRLRAALSERFKDKKFSISRGGDELFIFIEGMQEIDAPKVLADISEELSNVGLPGRTAFSFDENNAGIFESLDSLSSISKPIEKEIDKILQENNGWDSEELITTGGINIVVDVDKGIQSEVLDNIGEITEKLPSLIDTKSLFKLLGDSKQRFSFNLSLADWSTYSVLISQMSNKQLKVSLI